MSLFNTSKARISYISTETGEKVYPVLVDIKKGVQGGESIQFVSSDINTGILSVAFMLDNADYNVNGKDVVCTVQRPDTTTLELPCKHISNNVVEVHLGVNGTSQSGTYNFDFKVYRGNDEVVGTPILNYTVSQSIGNDMVVEDDDRLPVLTELVSQLSTAKQQANTATNNTINAINNAVIATNNANSATTNANNAVVRAEETLANINNAIASGTQDLEVKEARDGEISLKARLDRDIEKAKEIYVPIEGTYISTDSSSGYAKDVEILGNTVQDASNLADIRSVGDKVEGQELYEIPVLSVGKNLFDGIYRDNSFLHVTGSGIGDLGGVSGHKATLNYVKLKPNSTYRFSTSNSQGAGITLFFYDKNKKYIRHTNAHIMSYTKLTTNENEYYIRWYGTDAKISNFTDVQIEEGTQLTPYEPYVEDKLTILSPTPLEKVGDVADRIICKDGVWGVEKNVLKYNFQHKSLRWNVGEKLENSTRFHIQFNDLVGVENIVPSDLNALSSIICNKYITKKVANLINEDTEGIGISSSALSIRINNNKLSAITSNGLNEYLAKTYIYMLYQTNQPTFIPLPHSQQVKLRTFASKTNISFLTEIEGTIKAQVPKSLGATVNTHTEQIGNLNKELDRVKKLEESTVSTVTTESDFTTVEETSNGYFEDVKLEGKTLVNLFNFRQLDITNQVNIYVKAKDYDLTKGKEVTLVNNTDKVVIYDIYKDSSWVRSVIPSANTCIKTTLEENEHIQCCYGAGARGWDANSESDKEKMKKTCIVLEGDHTQNPPSFFEGLKSVGQDVEEVRVESVKGDGNLCEGNKLDISIKNGVSSTFSKDIVFRPTSDSVAYFVDCEGSQLNNGNVAFRFLDKSKNILGTPNFTTTNLPNYNFKFSDRGIKYSDVYYLKVFWNDNVGKDVVISNLTFISGNVAPTKHIPHQSNKKSLLYYNPTTQTWEKPALRQWDSIEKHSDGKYYYHKRSGEVVLNGSENWGLPVGEQWNNKTLTYAFAFNLKGAKGYMWGKYTPRELSNKFSNYGDIELYNSDIEGFTTDNEQGNRVFRVLKTKLSTQDVAGFKQWLQTNPTTVVYELAQEEVYECINIDLLTYNGETNFIINSGAIAPKTILKVHSNISNVVKILQEKVSLLENKFIEGLKQVLAGDMYSLAELLYPEDFKSESSVMTIPLD